MPKTTHISPVASAYATSLLELAEERKLAEPIGAELAELRKLVDDNPTFKSFLADPSIGEVERGNVLSKALDGKVQPLLGNFVKLLNVKGRLSLLSEIAGGYSALLDQKLGKIAVDVTVARKLSDSQMEEVRKLVGQALGKTAMVSQHVDDSIIGGIVLRVQDKLIDGSVKSQLAAMKSQMLATMK